MLGRAVVLILMSLLLANCQSHSPVSNEAKDQGLKISQIKPNFYRVTLVGDETMSANVVQRLLLQGAAKLTLRENASWFLFTDFTQVDSAQLAKSHPSVEFSPNYNNSLIAPSGDQPRYFRRKSGDAEGGSEQFGADYLAIGYFKIYSLRPKSENAYDAQKILNHKD